MRYSAWISIISVLNVVIITSLAWSTYTLMTMVLSFQGLKEADYTGQPFMIIVCLIASILNTPAIAGPILKYPEQLKNTMIYCVFIPLAVMIIAGVISIFYGVSNITL